MKPWREKLIEYGTYFVVFLMPVLCFGAKFYLSYSTSKTFLLYGAVEIIFAFWAYQAFIDSSYRLSKKDWLIFAPFLAYVFWLTLAGIFGADFEMSFWSSLERGTGLLTLFHVSALAIVIGSLIKKYGLLKYGHKLLAWFICGASILAISVWLGNEGFNLPWQFLQKSKGGGLMGNSSLAATVLVFAIFFELLLLFAKDVKNKYKIVLSLALALIIFSPLFINVFGNTFSARGALAGMFTGVLAMAPFYLFLSKKKFTKTLGAVLIFSGVVASIFIWQSLMKPGTTIHEKFSESATESRFIFWNIARTAMRERPLLGYGPENYRVANQTYFDPKIYTLGATVEVWNDRAHNVIFDTGVAGGYPAIILYFVFLSSLLFGLYGAYKKGKISKAQAAVLGSLVIAYFFQNLFVFDSVSSLAALVILIGIVFGINGENSEDKNKRGSRDDSRQIVAGVIIVLFIPTWIFFVWMPSRKAVAFAEVITMPLNQRPDHYVDLLKGSVVGNYFEVGGIADDAYHLYHDNRESIIKDAKTLPYALKDLEKFIAYLEAIAEREPHDGRLHLNLERLYLEYMYLSDTLKDETLVAKALAAAENFINLSPNDPEGYWTKAVIQFRSEDVTGARETAQKAIEIAPYIEFSKELLDQFSK